MNIASPQPDAAAIEQLIFQVRGIQAVRVVTTAAGSIDEIHVVGMPGRSPKQMVRDIESILYVQGGMRFDHRKVSLVQLDEGSAQRQPPRVLLQAVSCAREGGRAEATVTLGLRERKARGLCAGAGDELLMLTARATVGAILELLGGGAELEVEQMAIQGFGPLRVCLSHLSLTTDGGVETLLGISLVREDEQAAAARAILDGVNRPLLRLMAGRL